MVKQIIAFLAVTMIFIGCKKEPKSIAQEPISIVHNLVFTATGKGYSTVLSLQSNKESKTQPEKLDSVFHDGETYRYKITCKKGDKLQITVGPGDSKPDSYHYTINDNGRITDDGIISNVAKGSELVINYLVK